MSTLWKMLDLVEEFHSRFDRPNRYRPTLLDGDESTLRHSLMEEENDEYRQAAEFENLVEVADSLGDQLYVLLGTILAHGLQGKIVEIFDEIHRSNMSKLGADGRSIHRADGKVMKGPNYTPPDIKRILGQ